MLTIRPTAALALVLLLGCDRRPPSAAHTDPVPPMPPIVVGPKTPEQLDKEADYWIKRYDHDEKQQWVEARWLWREHPEIGLVHEPPTRDEVKKLIDDLYAAGALRVAFNVPEKLGGERMVLHTMTVIFGGDAAVRERVIKVAREADRRLTELGRRGFIPKSGPTANEVHIALWF